MKIAAGEIHLNRTSACLSTMPVRKQNRLKGYDYSSDGAYFVTICTKKRECIFGEVIVGDGLARPAYVNLSEYGLIVDQELRQLPSHYNMINVNRYVIMPNHLHAILTIGDASPSTGRASPSPTLGNIVGGVKSGVSRLCGFSPWQRFFHDHIIRNEQEYVRIVEYIKNNPETWDTDCHFIPITS